jgi:hypothetical protein
MSSNHVTREELVALFHLPISEAAMKLGICTTVIKKICRGYGIPRWPQRKVTALQKRIESLHLDARHVHNQPEKLEVIQSQIMLLEQELRDIVGGVVSYGRPFRPSDGTKGNPSLARSDSDFVEESPREELNTLIDAIKHVETRPTKRRRLNESYAGSLPATPRPEERISYAVPVHSNPQQQFQSAPMPPNPQIWDPRAMSQVLHSPHSPMGMLQPVPYYMDGYHPAMAMQMPPPQSMQPHQGPMQHAMPHPFVIMSQNPGPGQVYYSHPLF